MSESNVIYRTASEQHGLVTRTDLDTAGVTRARRRTMLRSGQLEPLGRHTFRIGGSPTTTKQRIMAACLDTGGVAAVSSAAWLHGLQRFTVGSKPEVVVARRRYDYAAPTATVHTSTWLPSDDITLVDGIPCLGVARALFSLAAQVPRRFGFEVVRGAVDSAVADNLATDPWLWWRLEQLRCRGRNGVATFERILTLRAGGLVTESWLERETVRLLESAGLPIPVCQRRIAHNGAFAARVDFEYPGRLVIEVSGFQWHRTPDQLSVAAQRRRTLTLAGFRVLEFSYDDIVKTPDKVVAQISEALGMDVLSQPA